MTRARRAARAKWVCVRCTVPLARWPGAACPRCAAFSTAIVTLDEARARGLPLPMSMLGDATTAKATRTRWRTGLRGFDRILSHEGGIVPAASVILAACPGGGKTTLLLAACGEIARRRRAVYASAEQDVSSLRALAERLGVHQRGRLLPVSVRSLEAIEAVLRSAQPSVIVVDSANELARHTRTQTHAIVGALHEMAHSTQTAVIVTSHVNASGLVRGGPEVAHQSDAVMLLSGDPKVSAMRTLGADKNRHGDTTITASIKMTASGFVDVDHAPAVPQRPLGIGAALAPVRVEGRPTMIEVQAMIGPTLSNPRRITTAGGIGVERVRVLVAVAEREGVLLAGDVTARAYGALAGDPGPLDAAIVAALVSASQGRALPVGIVFGGEVGLDGTVRGDDVGREDAASVRLRLVGWSGERIIEAIGRAHLSRAV